MNFNTSTKRRVASADRLNMIEQYHTDEKNLKTRANMSLACLQQEEYTDTPYRNICYSCASQIFYAYKEGAYLAGFSVNKGNKGYRWMGLSSPYLLLYAPGNKVQDASGIEYSPMLDDVEGCWSMFKYFGGRDDNLNDYEDVFDDSCIRQRNIIELIEKRGNVLEDMDVQTDFWGNISKQAWKKEVVTDVKLKKWNSDPEPKLPSVSDFRGLVSKTSSEASALSYARSIANINLSNQREPWMDYFFVENMRNTVPTFLIHDDNYTREFVDYVSGKLAEEVFFQSDDGLSWAILTPFIKEINIVGKTIKPEYENEYNLATEKIKKEIYETYPENYFNCKYELKVKFSKVSVKFSTEGEIPMKLVEVPSGNALCDIVKNYSEQLVTELRRAYNTFLDAPELTRCLEHEPDAVYSRGISLLRNSYFGSKSSCENIINYCRDTLIPWISKRAEALYAQTTDDENADKFIKALSKRLNKNTGTLMIWYQNIVSIDQANTDLKKEKDIVIAFLKGIATTSCYENTDPTLSCNSYCPNYIDLKQLDSLYESNYDYCFHKGDTVYICDDTHTELKATVINAEDIYIKSTSYQNATFREDGKIENTINTHDRVLRLTLDRKLPTYYCNGNDVSSLRCSKIY